MKKRVLSRGYLFSLILNIVVVLAIVIISAKTGLLIK